MPQALTMDYLLLGPFFGRRREFGLVRFQKLESRVNRRVRSRQINEPPQCRPRMGRLAMDWPAYRRRR